MKKITLAIFALFVFGSLMAQREVTSSVDFKAPFTISSTKTNDTLYPPSALLPCFDTLTIYTSGAGNYITGNNSYGDKEKAQKYNFTGSGTVSSVLVYAIAKSTTGSSTVKIYDINPTTKAPNTSLGQSAAVANSAIVVNNVTPYDFSPAVSFSGNFACSVVLPTGATDTLVVVSTKSGCYSNDSLTWEMWSDDTWYSLESQYGTPPNNLKCDMVILPVIQTVVGMTEISKDNLVSIFPNPANDFISIGAVNKIEKVSIYNTVGQLVRLIQPNDNIMNINVSDLNNGFYIMQVQTEKGIVAKTISIQ